MENEQIRVRIAPSPTGKLHLGTARAALFNYLYAKRTNGRFILRIEDTDRERSKEEYEIDITDNLTWLGINCDEGPLAGDGFGPYRQSERLDIYQKYQEQLLIEKKIYHCFCTEAELEKEREAAKTAHKPYIYSGKCRNLTEDEISTNLKAKKTFVLRFQSPDKIIEFEDLIRGNIKIDTKTFGDFVVVKSDNTPLFLFASVLDDALMKITHVIRGEDHISNTPKQLLILEALGLKAPIYGHLPLIVNADHSKLSKRKNPTSITDDYRQKGYLPEALINFMAYLGWNPGDDREFFTLKELEQEWSIEHVGKSPAVFDQKKLENLNGYYVRKLTTGELADLALPFVQKISPELIPQIDKNKQLYLSAIVLVQERIKRLEEIPEFIKFFFLEEIKLEKQEIMAKGLPENIANSVFQTVLDQVLKNENQDKDTWSAILRTLAEKNNISDGSLLWAIRYILTGEKASPGAFEMLTTLPNNLIQKRLEQAISFFSKT